MGEPEAEDADTPGWELGGGVFIRDVKKKTDRVWLKGQVTGCEGQSKLHVKLDTGGTEFIDLKKDGMHTQNPKTGYDDMTSLYYLHEPGVSENLEARYIEDPCNIYTWIGSILIVCNPFQRIPMPTMEEYSGKSLYANAPHNYAVAEAAFAALKKSEGENSQSIIISGESGAGKTESAKIVIRYLTTMAKISIGCEGIAEKILAVNPILEAFGNGTTTRNWNSSRFGKFTQLEFDGGGKELAGASLETYLLETSRVVNQMAGERNFHVFYHVFQDSECDSSGWGLGEGGMPMEAFHYINQSGTYGAGGEVDDKTGEQGVDEVIKAIHGIHSGDSPGPKAYVQDLYTIIAGILFLGNISFSGDEAAKVVDPAPLAQCAKLFGCSAEDLESALTHETMMLGTELISKPLSAVAATSNRDSMAKNMYSRCFDDVKDIANRCLGSGDESQRIGVLDIFGFESFEKNTFEQFCINFTNETLQATFNKHVFMGEVKIYESEGLQVSGITWPDNSDGLKVIEDVFVELDSQCKLGSAKDSGLCKILHQKYDNARKQSWPKTKAVLAKNHFTIKHYAGDVIYNVDGWLTKNRDTYSADISKLCREQCPGNRLVGQLWHTHTSTGTLTKRDKDGIRTERRAKFRSLGKEFMKSINKLVEQIDSTHVHFIRTLKTNKPMTPGYFQPDYVIPQLQDQGLLALCDLLKAGFPSRIEYGELVERFSPKMPAEINTLGLDNKSYVNAIIWAYGLPKSNYQCGLTKIFFRAGKVAILDQLEKITPAEHATLVKRVKFWLVRRRWRIGAAKAWSTVCIERLFRTARAMRIWTDGARTMMIYIRTFRKYYFKIKVRVAARSVARVCRMWPVRKEYLKLTLETRKRKAATLLGAICRSHLAQLAYEELNVAKKEAAAALVLQSISRMTLTQAETAHLFVAKRQAAASRVLQAVIRTSKERKAFLSIRAEGTVAAQTVQRLYRLISGESGLRFKSIVNQMEATRRGFFSRMDILVEKYTNVPPRKKSLSGGGSFELWVSIRIIKPGFDPDKKGINLHKSFSSNKELHDETFAGHCNKLKNAPGIIGDFFAESGNSSNTDDDGKYVWHRDPTLFSYIMDFFRDGDVSWPADANQLELLLEECDYFEVGPMVLMLVDQLKAVKFSDQAPGQAPAPAPKGRAPEPEPAPGPDTSAGACDKYRTDLTAAFGTCKCGFKKADH